MHSKLLDKVPANVRARIGSASMVCPLSGRDVFNALSNERLIIMGCNPRILHVIPGIMRAAEELDAVVAFELSKAEGGLDGGYTGQTPESFCSALIEYADSCRFTKPFIIYADHITVTNTTPAELEKAKLLIAAQIAAGFTSFALDASFNPLAENIAVTAELALPIQQAGFGLETELGEVKHVGSESRLTEVSEVETFLSGLRDKGIHPQLLAIDNGSKSGNYLDGQAISIDLERTGDIFRAAVQFGIAGLVQHGITGTPLRIVGRFSDFGIRKGNIGTLWQNIAHAGFPLDLMDAMRKWSRDNNRDIKHATAVFKSDIDSIPAENIQMIRDMAYREAGEFIKAFHAQGSAAKLISRMKSE
ncbi:fructose-bisphosphate aldolase [Geobacter sp. OR-1]|uniref:class II fructose-bisphosphate aldolase n=1 Tax=Geobacter sp. OR-1 TaxID=1266765 RepID=UPI00054302F6|nr:class II fructose-bisphosphate aldolase [Geobacter sp. OR-1]GAM11045.1 fructose-bisphosphate aldolase [Geobacter sp. OR-1]